MTQGQQMAASAAMALALSVTTSFAHVAADPLHWAQPALSESRSSDTQAILAAKARLRAHMKVSVERLSSLRKDMEFSCKKIVTENVTRKAIQDEPFTQVAAALRELESAMADRWESLYGMPIIGDEARSLRKLLAQTRSLASRNAMMLRQMVEQPQFAEAAADLQGVSTLAKMATERAGQLAAKRV